MKHHTDERNLRCQEGLGWKGRDFQLGPIIFGDGWERGTETVREKEDLSMSARSRSKQVPREPHEQEDQFGRMKNQLEASPMISLLPMSTSIPSQKE